MFPLTGGRMKRRFRFRVLAVLVVLGLVATSEIEFLTCEAVGGDMEKVARQRYADNYRSCKLAADPLWAALLPGYKAYEVNVFNPASRLAGRETLLYLLLMTPDKAVIFIEKDQDAVALLQAQTARHRFSLKQIVELFAHLRRVKILKEWKSASSPQEKEITAPIYNKVGDEQHSAFYVLEDPAILSVIKYDFYLSPTNRLRIESRWVFSRGGYD
jgi:hypothetical protein